MSEYSPLIIVVAVIIYTAARHRLLKAAQPLRLELAERGSDLLSRDDLSRDVRNYVESLLEHAFAFRSVLISALFAIPIFGICTIVFPCQLDTPFKDLKPELRAALQDFSRLHARITMANHPILMTLVNLEFGLIIPPMVLISGILRGRLPIRDDKETVMVALEARKLKSLHVLKAT